MTDPLLEVRDLTKYFSVTSGFLRRSIGEVEAVGGACGLNSAYMSRYPHASSSGQRQRIGIAHGLGEPWPRQGGVCRL